MYTLNTGCIAHIAVFQELHGQQCINDFFYELIDGPATNGAQALSSLITKFDDTVWSPINSSQSNELTNTTIQAQSIFPTRFQYVEAASATPTGALVGSSCPSGVSMIVRKRGDAALRTARGRIYIPGVRVLDEVDSALDPTFWATAQSLICPAMTLRLATTEPFNWDPIIYNPIAPAGKCIITTSNMDNVLRYQRRRELFRGL